MRTLLIDGDVLAYQIGYMVEVAVDWGDDLWTLHADFAEARDRLDSYINGLTNKLDADDAIVALTDPANFRKEILPTYKANRTNVRKPLVLKPLRAYLEKSYTTYRKPGLEGDDVLGILATHRRLIRGEKIIVSIDKDMRTIPGLHYNSKKPEEGIVEVSDFDADYHHMLQTLTGDTVDNYSGCPGIGPKKAEAILTAALDSAPEHVEPNVAMWQAVVATYAKAGLSEEEAIRQAQVARVLRASDYDFKAKKPILWQPPK